MSNKGWFVDSGIIAQGSADQGFEEIYYFQSMRLHNEAFGTTVQKIQNQSLKTLKTWLCFVMQGNRITKNIVTGGFQRH